MIYSQTDSGLLLAEHGASDERAVARALRDYDRDLRLVPQGSQQGRTIYKVYRYAGSDRPAEFLCFWGNDAGEPYPLSHRLLDKVRELDRNTRGSHVSEDELNARHRAVAEKKRDDDRETLVAEWAARDKRTALLPRGQSLRRARSKSGYHERPSR